MTKLPFVCVLFLFIFLVHFGESIRWLSLQHSNLRWNSTSLSRNPGRGIRSGVKSPCTIARRRFGFEKIQAKLCRRSIDIMPHIQAAAILASETCRSIFKHRRWNCSSIITAPFLTPDLTRGTREQAYVYAISTAALIYTMARACSSGALHHCTCASKPTTVPTSQFQWGGCSDNVKWGMQFAKRFIDNVEKSGLDERNKRHSNSKENQKMRRDGYTNGHDRNSTAVVNLHNNRVGRKVMSDSLQIQCKCHGVSGSCNIKTCWKALPPMSEIGVRLLEKYTNAIELSANGIDDIATNLPKKVKKTSSKLVYLSKSPDYCTKDEKLGSFGTVGRHCNVSSSGPESCRQLCCGRGYRTVVEEKIERCQCKFYNCCYVKCKICRTKTKLLSSSSSEDGEEIFYMVEKHKVPKLTNFIAEVVHKNNEKEFKKHFRIKRETSYMLEDLFKDSTYYTKQQPGGKVPISAETHILSFYNQMIKHT